MAKEVTHLNRFRDPVQADIGLDRRLLVVRCDDGSVYEFQKFEDEPYWDMRARGNTSEPPQLWGNGRAKLPADVSETLDEVVGEDGWQK